MQIFIDKLKKEAEKFAGEQKLTLYDVSFVKEKEGMVLRISLDGNVSIAACSAVSKAVSGWIDSLPESTIPYSNYSLEVSSLGLDRPLKTQADFNSQISRLCRIQTKNKDESGRRRYKGIIEKVTSEAVIIFSNEENTHFTIELNNIQKAHLEIEI